MDSKNGSVTNLGVIAASSLSSTGNVQCIEMPAEAACTCTHVTYCPTRVCTTGTTEVTYRDRWVCKACGAEFVRKPLEVKNHE